MRDLTQAWTTLVEATGSTASLVDRAKDQLLTKDFPLSSGHLFSAKGAHVRALGRLVGLAYPDVTNLLARLWGASSSRGSKSSRTGGLGAGTSWADTASMPSVPP